MNCSTDYDVSSTMLGTQYVLATNCPVIECFVTPHDTAEKKMEAKIIKNEREWMFPMVKSWWGEGILFDI